MPRSSSGVPWRPPAMRAVCTETPSGAMRQNSVSIVVLIEGTTNPILPRHPYIVAPCFFLCHCRETAFRRQRAQQLSVTRDFPAIADHPQRVPYADLGGGEDRLAELALEPL